MRITVVGTILIVAAVLIAAILISSCLNQGNQDPEPGMLP
jgi:hypothetical protein